MQYTQLSKAYHEVEQTSKRLEKTRILAQTLQEAGEDMPRVILLIQGRVRPAWQKETMGVSAKIMLKALANVTGTNSKELERAWSKSGDLGLVAEKHITNRSQETLFTQSLSVSYVHDQLKKLATISGERSQDTKLKIISELLSHAQPIDARYITRTILEQLRIGIASGTVRDAIIYAFLAEQAGVEEGEITDREAYNQVSQAVQSAYDKTNDFAEVAQAAKQGLEAINEIHIRVGTPIKVMLGYKGTTATAAMNDLGKPLLLQYKYDGFRVEIHKEQDDIRIFTRRLEDVTKQFPDIVEAAKKNINAETCILDAEAIGIDTKNDRYLPFQHVSQRIRRKHHIEEVAKRLPVDVRVFDILYLQGEELLNKPLSKRHELLEETIQESKRFGIAQTLITNDEQAGEDFFTKSLQAGAEGLFAKKIDSTYQPGTRVGNWIKIKDTMEPLDVVIIGAEWGEGKRSGWLTSFDIAVRDEENNLLTIGKVATGLKELQEEGFSFQEITTLLQEHIEHEAGRHVSVQPKIILEVAYEEIQKSPSYESGYALRFPRILRNRTDEKDPEDITSLEYVEELYEHQGI